MNWKKVLVPAVTLVLAAGCEDIQGPESRSEPRFGFDVVTTDSAAADVLAYAFARALSDPEVRRTVHQAWRNSQVSAHKLVLQEFVATPEGQQLVSASARAVETTPEAIREVIARLPSMDFYVPRREDRRTWKGTADVAVFATIEEDDSIVAGHATNGQLLMFRSRQQAGRPAVLLEPAEPKSRRVDAQPIGPGEVIEDATDGTRSGTISYRNPDGQWVTSELFDVVARQRARAKVGPLAPRFDFLPGSTTYVATFLPKFLDGLGSCEIRYTLTYYQDGVYYDQRSIRDDDVPCPDEVTDYRTTSTPNGLALLPYEPRDNTYDEVKLEIRELDAFDNDFYGSDTWKAGWMLAEHCTTFSPPRWCARLNW